MDKYILIHTGDFGTDIHFFSSEHDFSTLYEVVVDYQVCDLPDRSVYFCQAIGFQFEPEKGEHIDLVSANNLYFPVVEL